MQRTIPATGVLVLLLGVAACSGGGGGGGGGCTSCLPAPTPTPSPTPTASPTPPAATISVSKSTNTAAFSITVSAPASATLMQDGYTGATAVPSADASKLFADLEANVPVNDVATSSTCVKDSSFGTTTTIAFEGEQTGDVSCPPSTTSPAETLYQDATKIENDVQSSLGLAH